MLRKIVAIVLMSAMPVLAMADGAEVDCLGTCPSEKKLASFSDGNSLSCQCVDSAPMDDTVANEDIDTSTDPGNGNE